MDMFDYHQINLRRMIYLIVPLEPVSGATFGITGFVFKFLGFSKSNLNIKSSVDDDI